MTIALLMVFGKMNILTGESCGIRDRLIVGEIGDAFCAVVNCCKEELVF
jgi:hypothetical protein